MKGIPYHDGRIVSLDEYEANRLQEETLRNLISIGFGQQLTYKAIIGHAECVMKWIIAHQGEPRMVWRYHFGKGKGKYAGSGDVPAIARFAFEHRDSELTAICHRYEKYVYKLRQIAAS